MPFYIHMQDRLDTSRSVLAETWLKNLQHSLSSIIFWNDPDNVNVSFVYSVNLNYIKPSLDHYRQNISYKTALTFSWSYSCADILCEHIFSTACKKEKPILSIWYSNAISITTKWREDFRLYELLHVVTFF